jgi:hypothetical protein
MKLSLSHFICYELTFELFFELSLHKLRVLEIISGLRCVARVCSFFFPLFKIFFYIVLLCYFLRFAFYRVSLGFMTRIIGSKVNTSWFLLFLFSFLKLIYFNFFIHLLENVLHTFFSFHFYWVTQISRPCQRFCILTWVCSDRVIYLFNYIFFLVFVFQQFI